MKVVNTPRKHRRGRFPEQRHQLRQPELSSPDRPSLCGIGSRQKPQRVGPGARTVPARRERSGANLRSPGEFGPKESAFSSSPILIVNHVTEKKDKTRVYIYIELVLSGQFFSLAACWGF